MANARRPPIPKALLDLGYPSDLPDLPLPVEELVSPRVAEPWQAVAPFTRSPETIADLVAAKDARWGVGLGADESGQSPAIVYLVDPDDPRGRPRLPSGVRIDGRDVPVRALDVRRRMYTRQGMVRQTGAFSGSAISNSAVDMLAGAGGTLSGTFEELGGGGQRGVTNAHVALGWGIEAFLNNLPGSLAWLFRSPSGEDMIVSDGRQIGQDMYRLFRVDTPWPVLVWLPLAAPGPVLTFLYLDVAAGRVAPTAIPTPPNFFPPPPPPAPPAIKETATGGFFSSPQYFPFNQEVYMIGQELGLRWGRALLAGLSVILPVPIPGVPVLVVFNMNLYELPIAAGDSGAVPATLSGDHPTGVAPLGLGALRVNDINPITLATPAHLVEAFAGVRF